jgi:hypothetical protein
MGRKEKAIDRKKVDGHKKTHRQGQKDRQRKRVEKKKKGINVSKAKEKNRKDTERPKKWKRG